MLRKFIFWSIFIVVTLLAIIPTYEPLPEVVSLSDKLNHFAAFITLFTLHTLAYPTVSLQNRGLWLLFYGIGIEGIQSFLPTRSASIEDIAVDALAILAAMAMQTLLLRLRPSAS